MAAHAAQKVVESYHRAWTSGDVDKAMEYVDDRITCRAPGKQLIGKAAYRAFLASFAPRLVGLEDIATFVQGQRVALFSYPQTAIATDAPAAELFTVRDGKIRESLLIFDRLAFGPPPE